MLAIDWICGSSAWVRPTTAISSPMLRRPSTANQPASPITAATNRPLTTPRAHEEPSEEPRVAPGPDEGLLARPPVPPRRLGLGAYPLDHPVAGDQIRGPPHGGGQELLVRAGVPGEPLAERAHQPHRGRRSQQHHEPEQPVRRQQRYGDEPDGRDPGDRHDQQDHRVGQPGDVVGHHRDDAAVRRPAHAADRMQYGGRQGAPQPVLQQLHRVRGQPVRQLRRHRQRDVQADQHAEPQHELRRVPGRERPVDGNSHDHGDRRLAHLPHDREEHRRDGDPLHREDRAQQEPPRCGPRPASNAGAWTGSGAPFSSTGSRRVRGPRPSPAGSPPGRREESLTRRSRPRSGPGSTRAGRRRRVPATMRSRVRRRTPGRGCRNPCR
ncbi:hypothetical protein GA0115255_120583 [Streptomyces sp. Ncost-T6T-2b]|nr:hypothetical protein GA0115255_120583 [Streptomyces sp. Ncost-T6T-2b]